MARQSIAGNVDIPDKGRRLEVEAADETNFDVDSSGEEWTTEDRFGVPTRRTLRYASCLSHIIVSWAGNAVHGRWCARTRAAFARGARAAHRRCESGWRYRAVETRGAPGSGRRAARTDTPVPVDSAEPTQRPYHRGAGGAAPGMALSDGCVNAKSTAFSVRLHAGGRPPIAAATFRAIADLVPDGLPFLSPAERQAAGFADLFRQVCFVGHRDSRAEKEPVHGRTGRQRAVRSDMTHPWPSPSAASVRVVAQQLAAQCFGPRARVEPDREECARERRVGHVGREAAVGVEACATLGDVDAA
ncbi:hypothetical protein DM40_5358 [Burkholderia cenocepacia]|nr:hypothetical protein DM40_5358 [Burkholderia cenocepacia]